MWQKLSPQGKRYSQYLQQLGEKVTFIIQTDQQGFGHAVFSAQEWIGNEPFLLSLGDHIYRSYTNQSCSQQLINIYNKYQMSVIGLTFITENIIHKAGVVTGFWQENNLINITQLCEKPSLDYARANLHLESLKESEFLAVFGLYVLEAKIFNYLQEEIGNNCRYRGEFQLTTSLDKLSKNEGMLGYLVQGKYFDTGMPEFYRQTIIDFY